MTILLSTVETVLLQARESEKQTHEGNRLDYRKADFETIKEKIDSVNWRREFRDTGIEEAWKLFRTVYEVTVKSFVPVRKVKFNNRQPWLTTHVKRSLREKNRAWAIYKRTSRTLDFDKFKKLRNLSDKIVKTAQRDYEKALISTFLRTQEVVQLSEGQNENKRRSCLNEESEWRSHNG